MAGIVGTNSNIDDTGTSNSSNSSTSSIEEQSETEEQAVMSSQLQLLEQELAKSRATIQELKSQQARQNCDLEEANIIISLKDEILACKEVIHQQKAQLQKLSQIQINKELQSPPSSPSAISSAAPSSEENLLFTTTGATTSTEDETHTSSLFAAQRHRDTEEKEKDEEEEEDYWKGKFLELQSKYSELQNNRAWAEFQFRDRISNDGLKYRRRLMYHKRENEQLQEELQSTKRKHAEETSQLEAKWKKTASSVLQHTLRDLKESQTNVKSLEKEIARLKIEQQQPEIMSSSSKFLIRAATQSNYLN